MDKFKNDNRCILSKDRFDDYKECWEFVNKIAAEYDNNIVKLDFDYAKEYASIILETKTEEVLPQHSFLWHCLFKIPDKIEITPLIDSTRIEFIFNTELVEEKIEKYNLNHLDEILSDMIDDEL